MREAREADPRDVMTEAAVRMMQLLAGTMSKAMWAASRSWKRQGNRFCPTISSRANTVILAL